MSKANTVTAILAFPLYSSLAQGFVDPKRMRFWKPYDNSYYYFSRRKKNWYEAERYCLVRDSHLASILSFEEQVLYLSSSSDIWGSSAKSSSLFLPGIFLSASVP